jgi:hypothetical protein
MSVIITATYQGETFDVEVFHDGHIEFPDRDLRHEQAMAEFTDSGSAVTKLYDLWKESPMSVLFEIFGVSKNSNPSFLDMLRLSVDCVKHVLHLCDEYRYSGADAVESVIGILCVSIEKGLDLEAIEAAVKNDFDSVNRIAVLVRREEHDQNTPTFTPSGSVAAATEWFISAIENRHTSYLTSLRLLSWGVSLAAEAAATDAAADAVDDLPFDVDIDTDSDEWLQAQAEETAWQIRRFVDVMEAIGQGFDWPDMKATP